MRSKNRRVRSHKSLVIIVAIAAMLTATRSIGRGAQEGRPPQQQAPTSIQLTAKPSSSGILVSLDDDYRIGPRDVIEIQIEDAPELSGIFPVNSKGTFTMHYLGRITAQGKSPEELSKIIADGLRGAYLKDPRVSVLVKQYNSRAIFIQGSVRSPGVYQIEGRPSLLKLVTVAGGLAENHGSIAFIIRESKSPAPDSNTATAPAAEAEEEPKYELMRVNINGLLKGRFEQNVPIEPGDIINIPASDLFFVAGEVHAPGSYPLKEGTTLRQAISLAQGTTFKAAKDRGIIFREDESGKRQEIKVDINAVMTGKKDDVAIMANDIIIVPGSRLKSVGGALLNALGMGTMQRGVPVRY